MSTTYRSLHLYPNFVISAGTTALDHHHRLILTVHWPKTGETFLPKGRQERGETLQQTATRETFEETGYRVTLKGDPIIGDCEPEPIAISQRMGTDERLKIIFWYLAIADSEGEHVEGTQQNGEEEFEASWVRFEDAEKMLSFEDDRTMAREAISFCGR